MRLIDADALDESIRRWQAKLKPEHFIVDRVKSDVLNTAIVVIENLPTIDAEPVRHGRWEYKASRASNGKLKWHCSVCGIIPLFDGVAVLKYCHHCGAKMDGGAEE